MSEDTFGLGAELGPNLKKLLSKYPQWPHDAIQWLFEKGDNQGAAFVMFAYEDGFGRLPKFGLPTHGEDSAFQILKNPNDPYWKKYQKEHDDIVNKSQSWLKKAGIHTETHWTLGPLDAIAKIPVLGAVFKAAVAPITTVAHLAEGQPIGQAALDNFKSQIGAIKAVGPYVATVVSFVPGIGTGVAAALAAGTALAEGKPIDEAIEAGIKNAIPGGAIAASGFDLAKKIASGENVGKATLEAARAQLPAAAQKAFDIGLAVVSGKQLQNAIVSGIASLAPNEVQQILSAGTQAIRSTPGLSDLAKTLSSDAARQGLQLASGALAHAGINESQIRAMRAKLTGDVLKGFDTALQSQSKHTPWLANIVEPPATAPAQAQEVTDLQALAQLTPEQQKQLTDLQSLSQLTPDQQKQLTDYANARSAPSKPPEPAKKPTEPSKPPEPAKATPKPQEPTRSAATTPSAVPAPATAGLYPPYPPMHGTVSGPPTTYAPYPGALGAPPPHPHPHPHPPAPHTQHAMRTPGWHLRVPWVPDLPDAPSAACAVWGNPVEMAPTMRWAASSALTASKGHPTTVRGPDGTIYLFAYEGGAITARPCASFG